jgi:nucleoside-diphosphate-sugar epimerase
MRIFITGGSGFIGRHLVPLLNRHEVLCLSRAESIEKPSDAIRTIRGDLNAANSYAAELERFKPECCIHLAWQGLPDYSFQKCSMNLLAGINLFEMLDRIGCSKIFVVGTCWEYGKLTGAVTEGNQGIEPNLFAAFKAALYTIGKSNCMASGSRLIWGRVFFIYGPGQRSSSLIPACYRSLKDGVAPKIVNPLAVNDFIHVTDVVAAIHKLVEADGATGIYNIGAGRHCAVWEVVNLVAAEMGLSPVYHDMPSPTGGIWADISKMSLIGWQPEFSLQAGIARTLETLEADQ